MFFIACPLPFIVRRICLFENFEKLSLLLWFLRDILERWARGCCVHIFLVHCVLLVILEDVNNRMCGTKIEHLWFAFCILLVLLDFNQKKFVMVVRFILLLLTLNVFSAQKKLFQIRMIRSLEKVPCLLDQNCECGDGCIFGYYWSYNTLSCEKCNQCLFSSNSSVHIVNKCNSYAGSGFCFPK